MSTTVTESKFNDLKAKLRELFELDKSDLDFGIYRIMAAKNKEVNEFLDRQLKEVVRGKLAEHGAGASDSVQAELDTAIQQAQALGADPDSLPKVQQLKAKLAAAGGAAAGELEADIYNHLLAFFSRYYDEGDFISKRRYKGDVYAIPYAGEEVTLYWANKDQYYIKSGEWHKDYRFKVGGKTIHFKLVAATAETNNNKEPDDAKRRYILAAENPIEATDAELTLRFEFRVPTEAQKQAVKESEATRIFGGKYDAGSSRTQGDEREQFCADAEKRALAAMPDSWKPLVTAPSATESKPARTLLGKHLDSFTARNTFDYFIHKDLGGFLRRELDFYIKNEVVRLDDLEKLPADQLARVQSKVKAIRAVAGRIIDFLATIENFQKMWLKKKFVLETNWLVTIDRIPIEFREVVAANREQWDEWERLGFRPADDQTMLTGGGAATWGNRKYLDAHDRLVVDTALFGNAFTAEVLAREDVRAGQESIDNATTGVLIHSENFQALHLVANYLCGKVQCCYIDPPYNSKTTKIAYKNGFEHSSWASLMLNRLEISAWLSALSGSHVIAIDENEQEALGGILRHVFPSHERICASVVHNKKGIQGNYFSHNHEFSYFCIPPALEETNSRAIDERDWEFDNLRKWGRESERATARNCFYPIYVKDGSINGFGPVADSDFHPGRANILGEGSIAVYPVDSDGVERKWRYARETVPDILPLLKVHTVASTGEVQIVKAKASKTLKTVWDDPRYIAGDYGTKWLTFLGLKLHEDLYPKSVHLVEDAIFAVSNSHSVVLDYFGGSGTTGHAVINLNRAGSARRFILVEMGSYYRTVLKPRIAKVLYSPDWSGGYSGAHGKGVSALVKYFAVESYEDALNNLPVPTGQLLDVADAASKDALLTYSLDLELGPSLLNLDIFRDPWGYSINAQPAGEAEVRRHRVDLVETFNYLLGLKVVRYRSIRRYSADFVRATHPDGLGRLKLTGKLRFDPQGSFVFQEVEGTLNGEDASRVLVVWRKLTGSAEEDAAALEAFVAGRIGPTTERTEHRTFKYIYINGPVTLPQPTADIRTVLPIEETFKDRMFADTEGSSHA